MTLVLGFPQCVFIFIIAVYFIRSIIAADGDMAGIIGTIGAMIIFVALFASAGIFSDAPRAANITLHWQQWLYIVYTLAVWTYALAQIIDGRRISLNDLLYAMAELVEVYIVYACGFFNIA